MKRLLCLGLAALLASAAAPAQTPPADVRWEKLGPFLWGGNLLAIPGPTGDTLVADGLVYSPYTPTRRTGGIYLRDPGDGTWTEGFVPNATYEAGAFTRISTGTVLSNASSGPTQIDRRDSRTYEWTRAPDDFPGITAIHERSSDGALLAATQRNTGPISVLISTDDGLSWQPLGNAPPSDDSSVYPSQIWELAEARLADGSYRVVAGIQNGLAYSSDGGATWERSDVWAPFAYWCQMLAVVPGGPSAADTVYASVRDFSLDRPFVFASSDGGKTWEQRHRFEVASAFVKLIAGPGGVLYAGIQRDRAQETDAVVQRSMDGGRTWVPFDAGYDGKYINSMAIDDEGRLVIAGGSGVWRTVDPAYAVAGESAPNGTSSLDLRIWPNPTGGPATVALTLAAPERVMVRVYDVQGREVLAVWDGPVTDGQRFALDTAALAPGAYVVRAVSASGSASVGVTVVR